MKIVLINLHHLQNYLGLKHHFKSIYLHLNSKIIEVTYQIILIQTSKLNKIEGILLIQLIDEIEQKQVLLRVKRRMNILSILLPVKDMSLIDHILVVGKFHHLVTLIQDQVLLSQDLLPLWQDLYLEEKLFGTNSAGKALDI